jgi:hypothetical protein
VQVPQSKPFSVWSVYWDVRHFDLMHTRIRNRIVAWGLLTSLAVAPAVPMSAAPAPPPDATIGAAPITELTAMQLDGALTEEVWTRAAVVSDFLQRDPKEGAEPSYKTEARVAYDSAAIYVAVKAFDPEPDKIVGILTRRDNGSPSDWIRVLFDSYHDRRTANEFGVNPAGVKQDKYWFNDNSNDQSWDAVWDVQTRKNPDGWTAEFRIPFSQLRFNGDSGAFGFAVVRQIGRLNETNTWPLLAKSANGYVSSFGQLTGLKLASSQKRIELVPYTVGQVQTQRVAAGNPFLSGRDASAALGADLKYALTPGLTLTATVNPDFGQVEADPAVVNLSAFETFFQERRPFFIEGSGAFNFDGGLFYSRRIGRAPQVGASTPAGGFSNVPGDSTILGAAKLSGKIGGFSIGALNAVTAEEQAELAVGTRRSLQVVEPLTNYSVVRGRKEFTNQSSVGFMTTSMNRRLTPEVASLTGEAYVGAVDWDYRPSKNYSLTGYLANSVIRGDAAAIDRRQRSNVHSFQRPDAEHLEYDPTRTSLSGSAGRVGFGKIAGPNVRFNSNLSFRTPGFDVNDVGFQNRADMINLNNWWQWRHEKGTRRLRSFFLNINNSNGWNFGGDKMEMGWNVNAHWNFKSNWSSGFGFNWNLDSFSDRLTRGGPGGIVNGWPNGWAYIGSDDRKPIRFGIDFWTGTDNHGSYGYEFYPNINIRPTAAFSVNIGPGFNRGIQDAQWIGNFKVDDKTRYVFGRLYQTTLNLTTRVNYTLTPDLSIQIYAQPFVSAGAYTNFKELVNGRAEKYEDRYAPYAYAGNPDFNYKSFRTTNVLRWEYTPGSTLFVVWQQGRGASTPNGDFRFGRDFADTFQIPANNVFLVKFAYWLNY